MLKQAFTRGVRLAWAKFALGPPTQVDQFMADVDMGKDVPPEAAIPPMPGAPSALDGTTPLQLPTPPTAGSTVAPEMGAPQMAGAPPDAPPPSTGMLGG